MVILRQPMPSKPGRTAVLAAPGAMIFAPEARRASSLAESADFYRSSAIELAGDRAPRTVTFEL